MGQKEELFKQVIQVYHIAQGSCIPKNLQKKKDLIKNFMFSKD